MYLSVSTNTEIVITSSSVPAQVPRRDLHLSVSYAGADDDEKMGRWGGGLTGHGCPDLRLGPRRKQAY